ncbi:hypothetical protein [Castellaniella sp.]|uniref:hypothetical protein n=1 Tax=Castellaniella sp. TaxID=1955812 RepID=UPI002B000FA3|nr:hypothetical protein [Castellaniella sp.]
MNQYHTYVIRMPQDAAEKKSVLAALETLRPHVTAQSLEDEMTVLDCIEQHPDFPDHIIDEAREQAKEIIRNSTATLDNPQLQYP